LIGINQQMGVIGGDAVIKDRDIKMTQLAQTAKRVSKEERSAR
jgi:hypothetical protein